MTLEQRIKQGRGDEVADLVLRGGQILDLVNGALLTGDVAICGDTIVGTCADYDSRQVVDVSGRYGDYEIATARIDEITNIASTLVACGSLGVALLGIVFSGGTAIGPAIQAMSLIDKGFNIFKAAIIDIPQVGIAVYVMFGLVLKYDLLVTDICFGKTGGSA